MSTSVTEPTLAARPTSARKKTAKDGPLVLLQQRPWDRRVMQLLLVAMALWWLFPMWSAIKGSLNVGGFGNYVTLLTEQVGGVYLPRTFINSIQVAAIHILIVLIASACAGYAFSRLVFRGRELIYALVLLCLAVPATALLVPVYYITGTLGIFDTPLAVAFPEATLTLPFGVLLMRNFADGLPGEVFEAAAIDGAGAIRSFLRIYLPLVRTPMVNLAILSAMWSFQDFVFPSLVLRDPQLTTASQAVQTIQGAFGASPQQQSEYFAALVLLALPAVLLVAFGLRWISRGISSGGSKG